MQGGTKRNKRRVIAAERRRRAMELRLTGASYAEIGDELGISRQAATRHVYKACEKLEAETAKKAEKYLKLELLRLDELLRAVWPQAEAGDVKAVDRVLKIMAHRARLLGLDADAGPARQTVNVIVKERPARVL